MKTTTLFLIILLCNIPIFAQHFNLDFEEATTNHTLPDKWKQWNSQDNESIGIDTIQKKSGKKSLFITSINTMANHYGIGIGQSLFLYNHKHIALTAYIKTEQVIDGIANFAVSVGDGNKQLGYADITAKNVTATMDWTLYTIELDLPEYGNEIYLSFNLTGKGKIWIDDVHILLDGKDIQTLPIPKADTDNEFDNGSKVPTILVSDAKIKDLTLLGQIWGFLKYYHPAIAKGDYNWDYELFRILPRYLEANTDKKRNEILLKWIKQLGSIKKGKPLYIDPKMIKLTPDFSWTNKYSGLSKQVLQQIDEIKNAERTNEHYYVGLKQYVGNPTFKHEKPYRRMAYNDVGFRLLGLYRYWNVIQYYFPYKYLIEENWNDVLKEFVPKIINATDEASYKLILAALIARIHDSHGVIFYDPVLFKLTYKDNRLPLQAKFIENRLLITDYLNKEYGKISGLQIGDIILNIDGKRVEDIVKEQYIYTNASNYPTLLRNIANVILRTNKDSITISYTRGNKTDSLKTKCYTNNTPNLYELMQKKDTCFKMLTPNVGYFYPQHSTEKNNCPAMLETLKRSKGIVVDMRCYPHYTAWQFLRYLNKTNEDFAKFTMPVMSAAGTFQYIPQNQASSPNNDYYKGSIVVLVNEDTQSQAEYYVMALQTNAMAKVIGSTTAGADGNVSEIQLPSGLRTQISGLGVYYPDGRETQRIGIVPDVVIKPTIQGIQTKKDEVLEKAIEWINAQR